MRIMDNKLFGVEPRCGKLGPGQCQTITFTYKHSFPGTDRLPVLFKMTRGREILVCDFLPTIGFLFLRAKPSSHCLLYIMSLQIILVYFVCFVRCAKLGQVTPIGVKIAVYYYEPCRNSSLYRVLTGHGKPGKLGRFAWHFKSLIVKEY